MFVLTFKFNSALFSWCSFQRANMCVRKCFVSEEFKLWLMCHMWPIKPVYSAYCQKHLASQMSCSNRDSSSNLLPVTVFLGCLVASHAWCCCSALACCTIWYETRQQVLSSCPFFLSSSLFLSLWPSDSHIHLLFSFVVSWSHKAYSRFLSVSHILLF